MNTKILSALAGAFLTLTAVPALAHATLEQTEAPAGSDYKAIIRIGHGCGGKATKQLRVQIPEGFYDAKPMAKPGWKLKVVTGKYARPYDHHGTRTTEGAREIIWSGGELPDAWYDEFILRGTVGPDLVPGSTIYFPTIQECDGAKEAWIDVTGAEGVTNPAPALDVTERKAAALAHHDGHDQVDVETAGHAHERRDAGEQPGPIIKGELSISSPFARATLPGAKVAGGFLTIENGGQSEDRLIAASSPLAKRVEIHEMAMEGDVMRMRELPEGLVLPSGGTVELKPGGFHLMLQEIGEPLSEGMNVPVTLTFEKAGKVEVQLVVGPMNAKGGEHAQH
ncbi:DUF1775 domain-containing protein [Paracoccus sp. MBLB3053]|uniref:DUF1775 domain-containing protein n=1 Tax=Paracoccus aurantius TaxID=3073814 RepID=A0ABU2HSV9_9RHOB|nr:DUF1775 domain-containing protein [Paracoccus sp. MBLB3053]MDS9467389.1 DUF1775 domain-containing protein [Paracoccus sp. MBLB3053]